MKDIVRKVSNPKNELIRYSSFYLSKEIDKFQNSHVREYLKACLRQAIEYYKIFDSANNEISPLLGFYSILNLSKVITIIREGNYIISLGYVENKFKSHGASSKTIDEVIINNSGTFVEFARSSLIRALPTTLSIQELYKLLPDIYSMYNEIYPNQTRLIKVLTIDEYMKEIQTIDANVNYDGIAIKRTHRTDVETKYINFLDFIDYGTDATFVYDKNSTTRSLTDILSVDSEKTLYMSIDNTIDLLEEEIIYLIFLKYSSLVRYKPKNWTEKLDNDEYSIITKIIDESLNKFWSIMIRGYIRGDYYIL